jgi:serine protease inhibitor
LKLIWGNPYKFLLLSVSLPLIDKKMRSNALRITIMFSTVLSMILASCSKTTDSNLPSDPVPINLTADQSSLVKSGNDFAFDIFKKVLAKSSDSQNILISPLSISCALSMVLNGAAGTTRDSMLKALRVTNLSTDMINSSWKNLTAALLTVDKRVSISIANSVWSEKNFDVKIPFKEILTDYYNAEAKSFDISNPVAYQDINSWIEDKTNGLIPNMLSSLEDNTVMLLVNAIYFKGKWKSQFDKANTSGGTFYKSDGTTVEVPMMRKVSDYKIFYGEGFVMAEFPYGQGNFVMDVILPDSQNGINSIVSVLNEDSFNRSVDQLAVRETDLSFPRFKYGFKQQLNSVLADMGMGVAFTDSADFSNISDMKLLINKVLHQSFIETNEEGTEAAAATIVDVGTTSMPPSLKIDHSFLYLIRETTTNSILFIGKVADPLAN